MTKRIVKILTAILIPFALLIAGCSEQAPAAKTSDAAQATTESNFTGSATIPTALKSPLKVGLVIRTTQGGWLETYTEAIEQEVKSLGGTLQIFDGQNDLSKMATGINTAVTSGVKLLLVDNGTAEALNKPIKAALKKGISVVTYDSDITLKGVSAINQDDKALATNGLNAINTDFNGKANIVVLSVAGYAPLDNRLAAVKSFVSAHPGIKIVAQTGTVSGNAALDTQAQVTALLKSHPKKGQIDAIWTHWNDFSVGAFQALKAAGRSDIKLYTVDLTDQNLPFFWDKTVDFAAASASNPATIGRSQVRLGYEKVAGENVKDVVVEPVLVRKDSLPKQQIQYTQLGKYVPGWSKDTNTWPTWIKSLQDQHK